MNDHLTLGVSFKQAVVGSRGINDFDFSKLYLSDVVSGGAKGVDAAIKRYCVKNGIRITEIFPDYNKHGRVAPLIRNREIVDTVDVVHAIWDGKSRGTKYVIEYAKLKGKMVVVHFINSVKP